MLHSGQEPYWAVDDQLWVWGLPVWLSCDNLVTEETEALFLERMAALLHPFVYSMRINEAPACAKHRARLAPERMSKLL